MSYAFDYFEPPCDPETLDCPFCEETEREHRWVAETVRDILAIHKKKPFDVEALESHLEDLEQFLK